MDSLGKLLNDNKKILLEVIDCNVVLRGSSEIVLPFNNRQVEAPKVVDVLNGYEGDTPYEISSDVTGEYDVDLSLKEEVCTDENIKSQVIKKYIDYLANMAKEIDTSLFVLIDKKIKDNLSIQVGVNGDLAVTLLEIHKKGCPGG